MNNDKVWPGQKQRLESEATAAAPGFTLPRAKTAPPKKSKRGGYYDIPGKAAPGHGGENTERGQDRGGLKMPRAKARSGRGRGIEGSTSPPAGGRRLARPSAVGSANSPAIVRALFFFAFVATALWSGWLTQSATGYAGWFGIAISVFFFFGQFLCWYLEPRGAYFILAGLWFLSITFNLAGFRAAGGYTPVGFSLLGLDSLHYLGPAKGQELRWFLDVALSTAIDVAQEPFLVFALNGRLRKG